MKTDELKRKYSDWYNSHSELSPDDRMIILKDKPQSENNIYQESDIDNVTLIGIVSSTCKSEENLTKNQRKLLAISNLRKSKSDKTPIRNISAWLEELFGRWEEKPMHWTYIAERYTPKAINSVLNEMKKRKQRGGLPLNHPGAYFTKILTRYHPCKKTPKRKDFKSNNGTYKQQKLEKRDIP